MNGYIALYNGKKIELKAETSFAAYKIAVAQFKAPKSKAHLVSVHLCERSDGSQVVHTI